MSLGALARTLRRTAVADALTAVAFSGFVVIELAARMDDGYRFGATAWNAPLLLATTFALAWRRRRPVLALVGGYAPVLVTSLFVEHTVFFFGTLLPMLALTYSATRLCTVRLLPVPVVVTGLVLVIVPLHQPSFDVGDYLFWTTLGTLAIGLGLAMRRLDEHRAALAATLTEQLRDQDVRERALLLDERSRIARELHDVVAHAVSVMVVQAGAARLDVGTDDDRARDGLLAVEQAGRDALDDLRRLLGVLKPDDGADTPASPAPGLHMVPALVSRMRDAGLTVEVDGAPPTGLPAGLDQSLYRIVQESLTNVLKHAGPTGVVVRFAAEHGRLEVEIVDEGPADRPTRSRLRAGTGHGLVGIRERAAIFDGRAEAGPAGSGWRVAVTIPLSAGAVSRDEPSPVAS